MSNVVEFEYTKMDDADLIRLLRQRKLPIPTMNDGFLNKVDAARDLRKWDKSKQQNEERVWVIFHESSHQSAGPYVFASINNQNIQCPYNEKVCIPRYFLTECIDRAVVTEYRQEFLPDGRARTTTHKIPTYPYTVLGVATEEEVKSALHDAGKKRGRPKKNAAGLSGTELAQAV